MFLSLTLFAAGMLTILLPCILPLLPIVLGASIAGRSPWRPVLVVSGMLLSFVGFTFLLLIVLSSFVELADIVRIATYEILLLFGVGFITPRPSAHRAAAVLGAFFFLSKGLIAVGAATIAGLLAVEIGGRVATWLQQLGADAQQRAREGFGEGSPITAFIIGLTLGLVWVPCAGPALGFVFTLVRDQPGLRAAGLLSSYGAGTAIPLLLVGYGGQWAVKSVRFFSRYSGHVKKAAGVLLILSAFALQFRLFEQLQVKLISSTGYGNLGGRLEERLIPSSFFAPPPSPASPPTSSMKLPKISRAPEFAGLGPWHNSEPFTLASQRGKVVLVDFWTYSCINCIRTLPYMEGYWQKFKDTGKFILLGVHSPEFVFEKSEKNVADAITRHGLTYATAQDNDFKTWRAFANHYWPAKYLIDADGYIRYTHFGEGAYGETEEAIRSLLQEIGISEEILNPKSQIPNKSQAQNFKSQTGGRGQTPEIYLGERSWPSLGNAEGPPSSTIVSYKAPEESELHSYYLVGDWQLLDGERQVLRSGEGEIRIKFLGGEANLVMGLEENAAPVRVDVEINGEMGKSFNVDRNDLYNLFTGEYGEHEVTLHIRGKGVEGYAFTFGS